MALSDLAFRFNDFVLIPSRRELRRAGALQLVQPKVLDTLVYLVERRHRAVSRDELVAAVWGRVDVADNVVRQIVGRARDAVGDSGEEQRAIRTVRRFGYRWVVEATEEIDTLAEPPAPTPRAAPGRIRWATAALVLLGLAGTAAWWAVEFSPLKREASVASGPAPIGDRLDALNAALAVDQLDRARTLFQTLSDEDRIRPAVRHAAALLALKEGRADEAAAAFEALLADLRHGHDPALLGQALYGAGLAEARRGQSDAARAYYERAIGVLEPLPDAVGRVALGRAWTSLGWLLAECRDFDQAERAYASARTVLEQTEDVAARAQLERHVGVLMIGRYRHADAPPQFARAAGLAAQAKDVTGEVRALMNLANV